MLRHVPVTKGKEVGLTLLGVFGGGEGGDSHSLVVGFEVYVEQCEARGVRVPRAEVQRLDMMMTMMMMMIKIMMMMIIIIMMIMKMMMMMMMMIRMRITIRTKMSMKMMIMPHA